MNNKPSMKNREIDSDKIIRGFEHCTALQELDPEHACPECPYFDGYDSDCKTELVKDAFEMVGVINYGI